MYVGEERCIIIGGGAPSIVIREREVNIDEVKRSGDTDAVEFGRTGAGGGIITSEITESAGYKGTAKNVGYLVSADVGKEGWPSRDWSQRMDRKDDVVGANLLQAHNVDAMKLDSLDENGVLGFKVDIGTNVPDKNFDRVGFSRMGAWARTALKSTSKEDNTTTSIPNVGQFLKTASPGGDITEYPTRRVCGFAKKIQASEKHRVSGSTSRFGTAEAGVVKIKPMITR